MIYQTYQSQTDFLTPLRLFANVARAGLAALPAPLANLKPLRQLDAAYELLATTRVSHRRPAFEIDRVSVDGREFAVEERAVHSTPFGTLLNFRKVGGPAQPAVLLVAPMACHFATLLRETAKTMLPEHDVFITDWHNARDIPLRDGRFELDDYIAHLIDFIERMGPNAHIVAICQPCVAALAATALMAEDGNPATPASLTLMAGPIDARVNPTEVNALAEKHPLSWFEQRVVDTVPLGHKGAGRRVYPGFLQLAGFLGMNPRRHLASFRRLHASMVAGDKEQAQPIKHFYDEYLAVADLPAEFYLSTMQRVFIEHHLPQGQLEWRGRRVDPGAIRDTVLLTVEGANDDICGVGQTGAAHELCGNLDAGMKTRHVQEGAGHYGVFSGRRWVDEVYPLLRGVIAEVTARKRDSQAADAAPPSVRKRKKISRQ